MTVKEFLIISSIATEPEVIRTKLDELKKPYQLGQYKTPDTLNDINMGELMQLQSIETEHDILFVPCTVLMGLSKRYISQLPASDVYNPQNEMFRLLGTKRSFSQNETFFFSHPYPALFRLISHF